MTIGTEHANWRGHQTSPLYDDVRYRRHPFLRIKHKFKHMFWCHISREPVLKHETAHAPQSIMTKIRIRGNRKKSYLISNICQIIIGKWRFMPYFGDLTKTFHFPMLYTVFHVVKISFTWPFNCWPFLITWCTQQLHAICECFVLKYFVTQATIRSFNS